MERLMAYVVVFMIIGLIGIIVSVFRKKGVHMAASAKDLAMVMPLPGVAFQ